MILPNPHVCSGSKVALAPQAPLECRRRGGDARDVLAQMPLERRPPWHELEAQTVVDHGEAPEDSVTRCR